MNEGNTTIKNSYFAPLDVVRFFAAFWVMSFHYFYENDTALDWYRYGGLGVPLFFIISGFVIVQSLKGKSFKEFAIGRFIRLYPLFWIICTVTYVITHIIPDSNPVQFSEYLYTMTMLGNQFIPFVGHIRLVDAAYWTLSVELIFYVAIAIAVSIISYKHVRYFFWGWFLLSVFAFFNHLDLTVFMKFALVQHASYFIFGGTLALIVMREARNLYEQYFDWLLLIASACYATYIHPIAIPLYLTRHPYDYAIVTTLHVIFFVGIGALVYVSKYINNKKMLTFFIVLGGLTYPLYLMHETIGYAVIKYITNTFGLPGATVALIFELCIILTAYAVYVQDKKMRAWLRTKLLKNKNPLEKHPQAGTEF